MNYSKSQFLALVFLSMFLGGFAQYAERINFNAKFEPVDKVIHIAGQSDEFAFAGYVEVMGPDRHPMYYMEYTGANDTEAEVKEELDKYQRVLSHYPKGVGLQLGLSMTSGGNGYSQEVADGLHDAGLIALAKHLDSLDRPVMVRIGYEANGFWNDYAAAPYREAFRHVTNIFRAQSDSIATVWCVHPLTNMSDIMSYYPGDDYVDWWSIDLFEPKFITNATTAQFLDSAEMHQKPVLIGEANPTKIGVENGQQSWNEWYELFFNTIKENPVIKGFSYINRDWKYLGGQPDWLNSKLQDNSVVACLYRQEMDIDLYQHAQAGIENNVYTHISSHDAFVNSSTPATNYGNEEKMYAEVVSSSNDTLISYFKFNLETAQIGNISLAQVWLLGTCDHLNNQDIDVYATDEDWDETTVNWNNKPSLKQKVGTINVNDEGKYDIYQVDVTQMLLDSLAAGKKSVSFAIQNPAVDDVEYFFHTKEMAPDYPPTLQIIHDSDALQYSACNTADSGHPFLIVNEDMYADLRQKATQSPWKAIKDSAISMFAQEYDETLPDVDDKAILLRDIISSGTLLWILEPDSQQVYQAKIVETMFKFNDVMASRTKPNEWAGTVPVACASFSAIIALDVLYNNIDAADRDSLERLYFSFLDNQRNSAWLESYYSSQGIYYLYKGDRENFEYHKKKYRKDLEDHLTDDGIFVGGTGYSTSRYLKDEREQKYYFMDVLEFTGEDNYYDDPLFQSAHEWLFAHNFNTYGSIYIFGDAKMGTSIRGRLEESAGTWRVNRFSKLAAQNAAWQVQGKTPEGRLLSYLALDSLTAPVRPNSSKIYPDGGAWFVHNPSNEEHVSGVLWNPKSSSAHSHKETNSLHLAAFGEDLVVNSGYSNWGNGALGFSWNYINNRAKSSNTVLINNKDHSSKKGDGLSGGFIIEKKLAYAAGDAGPALNNGTHTRTLQMLYPSEDAAGYWIVFDKVKAYNPAEDFQVLLHPRSYDVEEIQADRHYKWKVQRWTENGVDLNIFLATPAKSVSLIDGVQADKQNSLLTKVLKSTYSTDEYGENQSLTVVMPSDQNHALPQITHINESDYRGAKIAQQNGIIDEAIEADKDKITPATQANFKGDYLFQRIKDDSVLFAFGRNLEEYYIGEGAFTRGFFSNKPVNIFMDNKTGRMEATYTSMIFTYPGITGLKLNGELLTVIEDGINTIQVTIPTGQHEFEIVATGIPEEDNGTDLFTNTQHAHISVFPNPVKNAVTISGLPVNSNVNEVKVYDLSGRVCHTLSKNDMVQSYQSCYIRLGNLTGGVYFLEINYQIDQDKYSKQLKIIKNE